MTDLTPERINELVHGTFPSLEAGIRCEELGEGWATARWQYDASHLRPGGYIPGPVLFGVADVALWFAVFTRVGYEPMAVTSDMAIHFLRPALDGDVLGRATLTRVGRRSAHGSVELWVDGRPDRLVAFASGAYALPAPS